MNLLATQDVYISCYNFQTESEADSVLPLSGKDCIVLFPALSKLRAFLTSLLTAARLILSGKSPMPPVERQEGGGRGGGNGKRRGRGRVGKRGGRRGRRKREEGGGGGGRESWEGRREKKEERRKGKREGREGGKEEEKKKKRKKRRKGEKEGEKEGEEGRTRKEERGGSGKNEQ